MVNDASFRSNYDKMKGKKKKENCYSQFSNVFTDLRIAYRISEKFPHRRKRYLHNPPRYYQTQFSVISLKGSNLRVIRIL